MEKNSDIKLEMESNRGKTTDTKCDSEISDAITNKKKRFQMDGPDGGWAWCVALAACSITFIIAGLARMSGIMYVAYIDEFHVTRQEAAYPSSIRASTKNLLGPAVGIIGQQYGVRAVTLAGGVIASISAAACYFAWNIDFIVVVWGGLNGIACAFTVTLLQVVIGHHFKKHHSTASGLSFSGGCVGSFMFPVLIEYLLHEYGLQGTFLIISAISMHIIPAAMVLRKPVWMKSRNTEREPYPDYKSFHWYNRDRSLVIQTVSRIICSGFKETGKTSQDHDIAHSYLDSIDQPKPSWMSDIVDELYECAARTKAGEHWTIPDGDHPCAEDKDSLPVVKSKVRLCLAERVRELTSGADGELFTKQLASAEELPEDHARELVEEIAEVCRLFVQSQSGQQNSAPSPGSESTSIAMNGECVSKTLPHPDKKSCQNGVVKKFKLPVTIKKDGFREHFKTALKLNYNPFFILVCLCRVVHFVTFVPFVTVLVDYGKDKGLPEDDGKYIIAALSAGDLVGRIGMGWITDRNCLSLPKFMLCAMVSQGALTATLPLVQARYMLMITVALFGMFVGAAFIRHPVLISKYMDRKEQSIAMGCINFVPGVIGFGLPPFIGYFRDTLGSYDNMFFITGSIAIIIGLLWLLEPQLAKCAPPRSDDVDDDHAGEPAVSPE